MARIGVYFLILMFFNSAAHAGQWIDDWVNQKTSTGPDYFETQKRGYATFGSASARWRTGSDHLVTITKPKFEAGCGGVDAYLGGFGFLQFDKLVDRFQQSMGPAAAAFAFDIALGVLSQQASTSVKSLSAIVDRLNQLQLDDCKAAKAVVATIADKTTIKDESYNKSEAVSAFLQSSGITDLREEITSMGRGNSVDKALQTAGGGNMSALINGCPQDLKDVFFTTGWVLDHLGVKKGLHANYTALMRGMVGDVYIDGTSLVLKTSKPCEEMQGQTIRNFIQGETYVRNSPNAACTKSANLTIGGKNYSSIRDWVFQTLESVGTKIINRNQDLTPDEESLLRSMPAAIYKAISIRVVQLSSTTAPAQVASEFADFVATAQVFNMLHDFYATMDSTIRLAQTTYETQKGAASETNQNSCYVILAEKTVRHVDDKRNDLAALIQNTHHEYQQVLTELNSTLALSETLDRQEASFEQESASNLGSQAKRMTE